MIQNMSAQKLSKILARGSLNHFAADRVRIVISEAGSDRDQNGDRIGVVHLDLLLAICRPATFGEDTRADLQRDSIATGAVQVFPCMAIQDQRVRVLGSLPRPEGYPG